MSLRFKCAFLCLAAGSLGMLSSRAADVGSGAPSTEVRISFQEAYFRGRFQFRAAAPPANDVRRFGTAGFVQEFADPTRPGFNSALVNFGSGPGVGGTTVQMLSRLFRFWAPPGNNQTSGLNTYGFPLTDAMEFTASAPGRESVAGEWQEFETTAAIFSWASNPEGLTDTDFPVQAAFYSRWVALGREGGLGFAVSSQAALTSPRGGQAQVQRFTRGGLYQWSAGSQNGQLFSVREPFYTAYRNAQGESGFLGLPLGEERLLAGNRREQSFEGGTLESINGAVAVRPRVVRIRLIAPNPLRLDAGQTAPIRAELETIAEQIVTDRQVTFTVGNQTVATVASTGLATANVRGVGNGSTTIAATSEGVTSSSIPVIVTAPCCRVGEGTPAAVSEAMLAALQRNRIDVRIPLASPARRSANGWIQDALSPDGLTAYVLTRGDASANAYILAGDFRTAWEAAGGAPGILGFPTSDRTPGGRQDFENGSLAGRPARLVSGAIRTRWQAAGAETGPLGNPTGFAASFLSFAGTSGFVQAFDGGLIVLTGSRAIAVTGAFRDRYAALGGPTGNFGAPLGEVVADRQLFEGGSLGLSGSTVIATETPRQARVNISPRTVAPGNRVQVAVGGFWPGARVRVSFPGVALPPFLAPVPGGAFTWDIAIPADARAGTFTIRAEDIDRPGFTAQSAYSVSAPLEIRLSKRGGDNQTGVPAALAAEPLRIAVTDGAGIRLAGQRVRWEASPGSAIEAAQTVTDEAGEASARVRLPPGESIALASVIAGSSVETFSARAAARELVNFPRLLRTPATTSLLAAAASVLRFRQQAGQIPAAGGLADVEALHSYLGSACVPDTASGQICDGYLGVAAQRFVNLWRLPGFTGGGFQVRTGIGPVRDWVAAGDPAIVSLRFRGEPHAVVAIGVAANGAVLVHDPDPALALGHLDAYVAAGGEVLDMARFVPGVEDAGGFLVFGTGPVTVSSPGRTCASFRYSARDTAAFCDGSAPVYQLDLGPDSAAAVTSLTNPGQTGSVTPSRAAAYRIYQPGPVWLAEPLTLAFDAGSVVSAANFRPGIAPGGAASIFGSGLANASVEFGGLSARVLFVGAFQLNFEVPAALPLGSQPLRVRGPIGEAVQNIVVERNAPAVFSLAEGSAAVTNSDGSLNRSFRPAPRGGAVVLYVTGLGQTAPRPDGLAGVAEPVAVVTGGREYVPLFAGLTPGFPGLYQVNWAIPPDLAPGLLRDVRLRQGSAISPPVEVAVQ